MIPEYQGSDARLLIKLELFGSLQTLAVRVGALRAVESFGLNGDVAVMSADSGWKNVDALKQKVLGRAG